MGWGAQSPTSHRSRPPRRPGRGPSCVASFNQPRSGWRATETFYDVSWLGDRFAAVGGNRSVLVSDDGLTWEDRSVEDSYPRLNGVSTVNGKIVIVAEDGHILMSP